MRGYFWSDCVIIESELKGALPKGHRHVLCMKSFLGIFTHSLSGSDGVLNGEC